MGGLRWCSRCWAHRDSVVLVDEWHKCREGEEGEGWPVCFGSLWSGVAVYRWLGLCGGFDANLALSLKIGTSAGDW